MTLAEVPCQPAPAFQIQFDLADARLDRDIHGCHGTPADYAVRLDSQAGRSYSGKRTDMMVALSFADELWHIGIVDPRIRMDDSAPK